MPEVPDIPLTGGGALGYAISAVLVGWMTIKKYLAEQRGESQELQRMAAALSEERAARIEAEKFRDEAWRELNQSVREIGEFKQQIARLEAEMGFMRKQLAAYEQTRINHP